MVTEADIRARRNERIARILRRKPYKQKPDLRGMRKRDRRYGYGISHYGFLKCLIRRRPNRTARHRDRDVERRELKPRPPTPKRNPHRYHRERERAETRALVAEACKAY